MPPRQKTSAHLLLFAGILLIAANLRAPVTSLAPVLAMIQVAFGLGTVQAGVLTTLPLLAFALLSPLAPLLARHVGLEHALFAALVLIAGIYLGGVYGGSRSAILLNIPGAPAAIATGLDGYPLAKRGEAGAAIGLTTVMSVIGGFVGIFALAVGAPLVASFALKFGPPRFACRNETIGTAAHAENDLENLVHRLSAGRCRG